MRTIIESKIHGRMLVELMEDKLTVLDSSFKPINLTEHELNRIIEILKNPENKEVLA